MKKQSSIDWLIERIAKHYAIHQLQDEIEQAKAMHKKEIENAVSQGWDYNEEGIVRWMGEHYYSDTFE